jgi:hypothetical protein
MWTRAGERGHTLETLARSRAYVLERLRRAAPSPPPA